VGRGGRGIPPPHCTRKFQHPARSAARAVPQLARRKHAPWPLSAPKPPPALLAHRILWSFKLNPYEKLNLPFTATPEEVRRQYRKISLMVHPDKCSHPQASVAFDCEWAALGSLIPPLLPRFGQQPLLPLHPMDVQSMPSTPAQNCTAAQGMCCLRVCREAAHTLCCRLACMPEPVWGGGTGCLLLGRRAEGLACLPARVQRLSASQAQQYPCPSARAHARAHGRPERAAPLPVRCLAQC